MDYNPFQVGDIVRCNVDYYVGLDKGQHRTVRGVFKNKITLRNPSSPYGTSDYIQCNFSLHKRPSTPLKDRIKKEQEPMATEKTKYFAMIASVTKEGNRFNIMDCVNTTFFRDTPIEVEEDIKSIISEGQHWIIVKTVAMIELEPPKPVIPLKITHYR